MGRPKLPDRLIGIDLEGDGRWRLRWVERGKRHQSRWPTEQAAIDEQARVITRLASAGVPKHAPVAGESRLADPLAGSTHVTGGTSADASSRGRSQWWRDVLSASADKLATGIADGTVDPLQGGRVLASLGVASAKHTDNAQLEEKVDDLEGREKEITQAKKHGARSQRTNRPSREGPVPGEPVH